MYILNQIHCCPKCGSSNVEEYKYKTTENVLSCECGNIFEIGEADLKEQVESTPIEK